MIEERRTNDFKQSQTKRIPFTSPYYWWVSIEVSLLCLSDRCILSKSGRTSKYRTGKNSSLIRAISVLDNYLIRKTSKNVKNCTFKQDPKAFFNNSSENFKNILVLAHLWRCFLSAPKDKNFTNNWNRNKSLSGEMIKNQIPVG